MRVAASIPHNRLVMVDQRSIPESLLFRHRVHHCRKRIFTRFQHFVLICVDPFLCTYYYYYYFLTRGTCNTSGFKKNRDNFFVLGWLVFDDVSAKSAMKSKCVETQQISVGRGM